MIVRIGRCTSTGAEWESREVQRLGIGRTGKFDKDPYKISIETSANGLPFNRVIWTEHDFDKVNARFKEIGDYLASGKVGKFKEINIEYTATCGHQFLFIGTPEGEGQELRISEGEFGSGNERILLGGVSMDASLVKSRKEMESMVSEYWDEAVDEEYLMGNGCSIAACLGCNEAGLSAMGDSGIYQEAMSTLEEAGAVIRDASWSSNLFWVYAYAYLCAKLHLHGKKVVKV